MKRYAEAFHKRMVNVRTALTVLDLGALVVAMVLVLGTGSGPTIVAIGIAAVTLISHGMGLQRSRLVLSVVDDLPQLALTSLAVTLVIAASAPIVGSPLRLTLADDVSHAALLLALLGAGRLGIYAATNSLRRRGVVSHPTIVVGDEAGVRVVQALQTHPEAGLLPVGMIDMRPSTDTPLPVPSAGGLADLERAMVGMGVDDVIFAFGAHRGPEMLSMARLCIESGRQVFVVPRFFELMGNDLHHHTQMVHGIPIRRVRRWGWYRQVQPIKRAGDLTLAGIGLLMISPLLLGIAIALRIETGPGVIFSQTRVGRRGEHFTLFKFRTLKPVDVEESATNWSVDNDSRLGPVGRVLRRTGLDELPQLFNVLRGDMSIVGPRPERPHFVNEFSLVVDRYDERHRVRSGITGLAQVNHLRGDTSIDERVRFDNRYIENWSVWADIKILARTLPTFGRSQPQGRGIIDSMLDQGAKRDLAAAPPVPMVPVRIAPVPARQVIDVRPRRVVGTPLKARVPA